jgi:hypothetical protein
MWEKLELCKLFSVSNKSESLAVWPNDFVEKIAKNVDRSIFSTHFFRGITFSVEQVAKNLGCFCIFQSNCTNQIKPLPNSQKFALSSHPYHGLKHIDYYYFFTASNSWSYFFLFHSLHSWPLVALRRQASLSVEGQSKIGTQQKSTQTTKIQMYAHCTILEG